ncbi:hypothetical protein [Kitasatospora purpeofusca]|uniref:hypothetical protein n=1 Tax=Kitasatospora purpeofusca TaxID=67352 RepID=UPI003659108F
MNSDDAVEVRETGVWIDGEIVPAVVVIRRPEPAGTPPPLPTFDPCHHGCPEGECHCGEPMLADFADLDEGDLDDGFGWDE